jgi:PIN domain nuclease of toxin-antitoxin system
MAALIHLDTHVVVWLYGGLIEQIPAAAQQRIESHDLIVSPIVALELQYLHEIKRLKVTCDAVLNDLAERIGLRQSEAPLRHVIAKASNLSWTRDPFDRLIIGNALADDADLLSADKLLRAHYERARWE